MNLLDTIAAANTSMVFDDGINGGWHWFVLDHLDYIKNNSETFTIDAKVMNLYQYDLKRFLKEQIARNEDIAWIVLILNGMKSDFEFVGPMVIYIPRDPLILALFMLYTTVTNNVTT